MNKLLSVDWDFFFPIPENDYEFLYDWGHSEDIPFMKDGIWEIRASSFIRSGRELPITNGDEDIFWQRFNFHNNAVLYYSESHVRIYNEEILKNIDMVWNFDAHHDTYHTIKQIKKLGKVSCENWVAAVIMSGIKVKNFFPKWKTWDMKGVISLPYQNDNGKKFHEPFMRVFVCRSGAWTPTWIDDSFWRFIDTCPVNNKVNLDGITPRVFSLSNVEKQIRILDLAFKETNNA